MVDEAYAGDIIGVFDPGIFSIGDTICAPGRKFAFEGIPTFAPEHFARVRQLDTMKRKQFVKGISHQSQIHAAIQNSCHSAETVGLPGVKIYVWNLAGESTENTWQKVGGRNGGNSQVNNFFILSGELFYNVAAHVQHIGGAVIEQKTALGDVQLLGGADQQPRIQFLFQGIDVGTDGGLGQIQLAGGFR